MKLTHYRTLKALAAQHLPLQPPQPFKLLNASTLQRFNDLTIAFGTHLLSLSEGMRLLAEILIIAALIYFGWNKPFNEYVAQANTTITTKLHGVGKGLQKHQDPSVRRY